MFVMGFPADIYKQLLQEYNIEKVFTNHDYEPYARERDKEIADLLKSKWHFFSYF